MKHSKGFFAQSCVPGVACSRDVKYMTPSRLKGLQNFDRINNGRSRDSSRSFKINTILFQSGFNRDEQACIFTLSETQNCVYYF
jgi:hypothetical protein